MKAQSKFREFIQESEELSREDVNRLQDMGLERLDPDEAWGEMTDEWYGDPEVQAAVALLEKKLEGLLAKWDRPEYEEAWQQRIDWMWSEADKDEIGTFDYFLLNR